jgi:hypothetical protein
MPLVSCRAVIRSCGMSIRSCCFMCSRSIMGSGFGVAVRNMQGKAQNQGRNRKQVNIASAHRICQLFKKGIQCFKLAQ